VKQLLFSILILTLFASAGFDTPQNVASTLMTVGQMAAAAGAGFWGGLACGLAVGGTLVGGAAIITAIGAGTTVSLGVAFATSVALHADAICALIE
jgi:hypothetical protein